MIFVDTGILIQHVKRRFAWQSPHEYTVEINRIRSKIGHVSIPGVVAQEILSGAKDNEHFRRMEKVLHDCGNIVPASVEEHVLAGQVVSTCRRNGVTVGTPDAIIIAQSMMHDAPVFAEDNDYQHVQRIMPILRLHKIGDIVARSSNRKSGRRP